ncbi:hypothetical protein I4U23_003613 [Adineta vaga]|nr:hypothetical protein I4U23_003613 [Adineta vaga]
MVRLNSTTTTATIMLIVSTQISLNQTFSQTQTTTTARINHGAVLLGNGKVMVCGGRSDPVRIDLTYSSCEFYSKPNMGWELGAQMNQRRVSYSLDAIVNGTKALAAGNSIVYSSSNQSEIYDSQTNQCSYTSNSLSLARQLHSSTVLKNGQVLIVGGKKISSVAISSISIVDLYDASTNSFLSQNNLQTPRLRHEATLLSDGSSVLVTGGVDNKGICVASAEIYAASVWSYTNTMVIPRSYHRSISLPDGNVLITGGIVNMSSFLTTSSAELYHVATGTFSLIQPMIYKRVGHTLTLLPSGKVLAAGGIDQITNISPSVCELYDPISGQWNITRSLNLFRDGHATVLTNNGVLIISGKNSSNVVLNSVERYEF